MKLTKAEEERLRLLQEEAAEVIQAVSKILRFGWSSKHPSNPEGPTNKEHLEVEIGGMGAVLDLMVDADDIDEENIDKAFYDKKSTINKWTKFQKGKNVS